MTISFNGTSGVTFPDASVQNTAATGFGFKNRIINGAMMIDQRNAGVSVTTASGYTLDRWNVLNTSAGTVSTQQVATAPSGFKYSAKLTVGTADASVAAGDSVIFFQPIEGYNISDLGFGTITPSAVTVSFWVNSSLTGTYTGSIVAPSGTRSYPFSYTVNAANTWEQKTVTFTADSSGTWGYTNDVGLYLELSLMCGSTYQGTLNTWQAGNYRGTSSQVNWMATSGNTFYITGVQLEKGSTATSFDYRPYGTELALCQRYYEALSANAGTNVGAGSFITLGVCENTTRVQPYYTFKVQKRTAPSTTLSAISTFGLRSSGSSVVCSSGAFGAPTPVYAQGEFNNAGGGLIAGGAGWLVNHTGAATIEWSAEL